MKTILTVISLSLVLGTTSHGMKHEHDHGSMNHGQQHPAMDNHGETGHSPEVRKKQSPLDGYLNIQKALAADDLESTKAHAHAMKSNLEAGGEPTSHPALLNATKDLAKSTSLEVARKHFFTLSQTIIDQIDSLKTEKHPNLGLAHCPMARNNQGASWIQEGGVVNNPYYGSMMLRCGTVKPLRTPK